MEIDKKISTETEKITEENVQKVLLNCMFDLNLRSILFSTIDDPKSMLQLSKENDIPLRTVYRKVQYLLDNKMLKVSGAISDTGRKFFLYKSRIRSITTKIDDINVLHVYVARNSTTCQ